MKKIQYLMFAFIMAAFTFTSCEDVPQPYQTPDSGDDTPTIEEVATGEGTVESPFNAVAANKYVEAGEGLDKTVYLTGIISSVKECSAQYGNASFYITEDGSTTKTQFYVYRVKGLGNNKIDSDDYVKVGDKVVVCAQLTNYNGTYETAQNTGYIYSLNGKTEGGSTTPDEGKATGDGTKDNPFNSIAANEYTSKLAADVNSEKEIYIKGKVVSVKEQYSTQYGNATFYISDDGKADNQFYVFRALYLDNKKYTEGTTLNPGDEVVVCGTVVNYKGNTPETVQGKAYLVSLKSNGGSSDTGETTGDASAANGDFECWVNGLPNNWKSTSTAGNATLSQSTDAHGGKYSVKVAGNTNANKRMAYKETSLKAGEYTMTFYAKAATSTGASLRPGYAIVTDGKISSGSDYVYGDYTNNITSTEWVKVTHTFTISADGTYCIVIMNAKSPGGDLLIDDFTLTCGSQTIIK